MEDIKDFADEMAMQLRRAAIWFAGYAASHKAKRTPDGEIKAALNRERSIELDRLVDEYEQWLMAPVPAPAQGMVPSPVLTGAVSSVGGSVTTSGRIFANQLNLGTEEASNGRS